MNRRSIVDWLWRGVLVLAILWFGATLLGALSDGAFWRAATCVITLAGLAGGLALSILRRG